MSAWPRQLTVERLGAVFVCLANALIFIRAPRTGLSDLPMHLLSAAPPYVVLALSYTLTPRSFSRMRSVLVPILRLAYHAQASERSAEATSAGLMLSQGPHTGPLGCAIDLFRLLIGTRLLTNALITLLFPLPLPLAAAVHAVIIRLTANNGAYCATPLLAHPLTQQRLDFLAATMHVSTLAASPMGTALARHNPRYGCTDVLRFLQATWAVLPIVLLAWSERGRVCSGGDAAGGGTGTGATGDGRSGSSSASDGGGGGGSSGAGSAGRDGGSSGVGDDSSSGRGSSGQPPALHSSQQEQQGGGQLAALSRRARWQRAWELLDRGCHMACGCRVAASVRPLILLWMLCVLWLLTTSSAAPSSSLQ